MTERVGPIRSGVATSEESDVELQGEKVLLREFEEEGIPAMMAWADDDSVMEFLPARRRFTAAGVGDFVRRAREEAVAQPRTKYMLAVVVDGEVIGESGVEIENQEDGVAEIGYVLRRDAWGRGYATEVARLLVTIGFRELGMHRIYATVNPLNGASIRVLEKTGMQYEGRLREHLRLEQGWRDSLVYAVLVDEWAEG